MSMLLDAQGAAGFSYRDAIVSRSAETDQPALHSELVHSEHSGLIARWYGPAPVQVAPSPSVELQLSLKRVMDIVVSAMALVALAPFLMFVALGIKVTSRGPVFFSQPREGLGGKSFRVWKFRTMRVEECDVSGIAHTRSGDTRITKLGSFLRKTSIDELPQLFNVLRGEMSLVGPRPHVPGMLVNGKAYSELVPYYNYRHNMLPGITGWAQANGLRGEAASDSLAVERVDHDVAYIQNYSLRLDLAILFKTVAREFITGSGR